jgi:hypothetical protein
VNALLLKKQTMPKDKKILKCYMEGFNDELNQIHDEAKYKNEILKKSYILGGTHAVVGDDVRSVDYLTNEQILKIIKKM